MEIIAEGQFETRAINGGTAAVLFAKALRTTLSSDLAS
jgi:hypothetical protein